jgi:anthranilate synthase component 1
MASLAKDYNVLPVIYEAFNASETPLGIYRKLQGQSSVFLLESAEQGVWSRYSFIGFNPRGELIEVGGKATWTGPQLGFALAEDPIVALEQISEHFKSADLSEIPLQSGLVGHMSWNVVRYLEKLPAQKTGDYSIPSIHFLQFREIVVLDHLESKLFIIHNIFTEDGGLTESYEHGKSRISEIQEILSAPVNSEIYGVNFEAEDTGQKPRHRRRCFPGSCFSKVHPRTRRLSGRGIRGFASPQSKSIYVFASAQGFRWQLLDCWVEPRSFGED